MATIHDVAKKANVSTTTVSKVLSNTSYVSVETRERVQAAMQELNYAPSLAARSLRGQRTYLLGLVVPYDPDYLFNDPFLLEVVRGVEAVANESDYNLVFSLARKGDQKSAYTRLLRTRYLDGVITVETFEGDLAAVKIEERHIPRVSVGYRSGEHPVNSVHANDYRGAFEAMSHLTQLGHRQIGIISGPAQFMIALDERIRAIRDVLAQYKLELDPASLIYGDWTPESGYAAAEKLLTKPNKPTAIFALNDRMAIGALKRARELGVSVPKDLSLVGFDDIPLAGMVEPALTTVRQPGYEIGKVAAQKLFELIAAGEGEFEPVVLPVEFITRNSTASL